METSKTELYSKKSPKAKVEELSDDYINQLSEEEQKEINEYAEKGLAQLREDLKEDLTYKEMLSPVCDKSNFIQTVKEYAETHDVDVEIIALENRCIKAYLSFDIESNTDNLPKVLALADTVRFNYGMRNRDITITLTYYTHICYSKSGTIIYPPRCVDRRQLYAL